MIMMDIDGCGLESPVRLQTSEIIINPLFYKHIRNKFTRLSL